MNRKRASGHRQAPATTIVQPVLRSSGYAALLNPAEGQVGSSGPAGSSVPSASKAPRAFGPPDPDVLAELREQLADAPEMLDELIAMFLSGTPALIEAIRTAVAHGDARALSRAAHSCRGSSASLGTTTLAAVCDEIELLGRGGEATLAARLLPRLEAAFAHASAALEHTMIGTAVVDG